MTDATLKSAVERLPFPETERRAILDLAKTPGRSQLFTAAICVLCGTGFLSIGSDGISYMFQAPEGSEPVPPQDVVVVARVVAYFFFGVIQLLFAVSYIAEYYKNRERSRIIALLVHEASLHPTDVA